jgi:hypothetical protein
MVVIDAGIATEKNLGLIRQKGYHNLCVSRKYLKDNKIDPNRLTVLLETKNKHKIMLKKVDQPENQDYYLKVTSIHL